MAHSIIALIFPEYDDKENVITSHDWKMDCMFDKTAFIQFINHLHNFVDFFKDEECTLIYDSKNLDAFTFFLKVLPDCYPYPAHRILMAELKNQRNLINWRKNRISSETDEYKLYFSVITDEIRTEIAARQETNPNDDYLIAVHITNYKAKTWKLSKDSKTYPIESLPMSIKEVFEWLATHRHPKREYHWNPKHGEFGKGAHKDNKGLTVSVLMGSREEAADIMPKAIGEHPYSTLHYYDNKYYKYMEYKQESTDEDKRVYHSFHIDDETRVPQRVKDKLALIN